MTTRLFLLSLLLAAPVAEVALGAEGSGEAVRLTEQLVSFVERGAWPAADRTYRELEALDDAQLTSNDLFMGAEAARSIGDMLACRKRLIIAFQRALDQQNDDPALWDERARAWLAELQTEYGHVEIQSKGFGELQAASLPFQPDRRAAIEHARKQLAEEGRFEGLLPAGQYSWGRSSFSVDAGTEVVKIKVKGPRKKK